MYICAYNQWPYTWFMYVCVCVYMYVYLCKSPYMYACECCVICMHVSVHTCPCLQIMYMCIWQYTSFMYVYMHVCICIYTCVYNHICMYKNIYTYRCLCLIFLFLTSSSNLVSLFILAFALSVYSFLECLLKFRYGVATISRLLEIVGLFCKRAL